MNAIESEVALNQEVIITDFDKVGLSSAKKVLPCTNIKGCIFHSSSRLFGVRYKTASQHLMVSISLQHLTVLDNILRWISGKSYVGCYQFIKDFGKKHAFVVLLTSNLRF